MRRQWRAEGALWVATSSSKPRISPRNLPDLSPSTASACASARHHPCPDRPQRRRQDHLLQPADQVPQPDARAHHLQRPRHHRHAAGRRRAARAGALVPDLRRVPALTVLENVRIALQRLRGSSFDFWRSTAVLDQFNERAMRTDRRCRARRIRRLAGGRTALWPQARARDRHHAGARSRNAAARRADRRHGARGHRSHRATDQARRRRPHRADGRAQSVGGGRPVRHITVLTRGQRARRGRLRDGVEQSRGARSLYGSGRMLERAAATRCSRSRTCTPGTANRTSCTA